VDNTWQITDDPKAVQLEVQKVECPKCKHYELYEPAKAKDIFDHWESFKCPLCYNDTGKVKLNSWTVCGNCNQTMGVDRICYCPVKEDTGLKIIVDPKNAWRKKNTTAIKLEHEIEEGKQEWKFKKKVINQRKEDHERQVQLAEDMHYLRLKAEIEFTKEDLKKVDEPKPKEYDGSAIR